MLCIFSQDVSRVFRCVVFGELGVNGKQRMGGAAFETESRGQLAGVEVSIFIGGKDGRRKGCVSYFMSLCAITSRNT